MLRHARTNGVGEATRSDVTMPGASAGHGSIADPDPGHAVVLFEDARVFGISHDQMVGREPADFGPWPAPVADRCCAMVGVGAVRIAAPGRSLPPIDHGYLGRKSCRRAAVTLEHDGLVPAIGRAQALDDIVTTDVGTSRQCSQHQAQLCVDSHPGQAIGLRAVVNDGSRPVEPRRQTERAGLAPLTDVASPAIACAIAGLPDPSSAAPDR